MRFKKSVFNSLAGVTAMLVNGLFAFIKISLIIKFLGNETNGLNNIYIQIFNFLMIGEAGLGLATTTLLYKPIAEKNIEQINKLIAGSQRAIFIIASGILCGGFIVSLFIPLLVKDNVFSPAFIGLTFVMFTFKAVIPQVFQPMKAYATANQDEYIVHSLRVGSIIIINIVEILFITNGYNYLMVVISGFVATLIAECSIFFTLKQKYPDIKNFQKQKDYAATEHMKQLVKVNVVQTVAKSVDPLIVSRVLGLVLTSFYSNYSYVQSFIQSIIGTALGAVTPSFGDMFAKKEEGMYVKFTMYMAFCNFIASTAALLFYAFIQYFVVIWIGEDALLSQVSALCFSALVYMYSAMKPMNVLIVTNGFFKVASTSALYETVINVSLSILFISKIGIPGVLIASLVSYSVASFWYFPTKTYPAVFGKSAMEYFSRQSMSIVKLGVMYVVITIVLNRIGVKELSLIQFVSVVMVGGMIIFMMNMALYYVFNKEFRSVVFFIKGKVFNWVRAR